jgi:2-polyprenyl-3-methyl-5-hydroxy-6-metoxy-1,4-benzoquinol methylase
MLQRTYDPSSFDHLAEAYDAATSIERKHDFFLGNLPRRRRRVLDIGCGTGLLAQELSKHFESVLGIDISERMLAVARATRSTPNIEYRLADASSAILEGEFDAIVSHTTFHHITDMAGTITRLKNLLAPQGRFLIIDLVDRWPRFGYKPYAGLILGACAAAGPDVFRHGFHDAFTLLRFRLSRHWLDHLKTDRYLSIAAFRQLYGEVLPGATITCTRYFAYLVWESGL